MKEYKDIQEVNALLKPIDIKGKKYIPVNERVKAFRMLYPEGKIVTDLVEYKDGNIIMKAEVYALRTINEEEDEWDGFCDLIATGYAMEKEGSSSINRFSALENCESSAVGRALGFLGIGIDTSIASYEEVTNAKLNEEGNQLATPSEKAGLIASARAKGIEVEELLKMVGFDREKQPEGMTAKQYGKAMNILNGGF